MKNKSKLPEITLNDWMEAEALIGVTTKARPEGSITAREYAEIRGCSMSTARDRLRAMHNLGVAEKVSFLNGISGRELAYILVNKNGKK